MGIMKQTSLDIFLMTFKYKEIKHNVLGNEKSSDLCSATQT